MEPGNICMASDSGGGRGWRRRVEIRPWSLLPGFSVCPGQVSAVKSRENYPCPFRTSSGGITAPTEGRRSTTLPHPQLSHCSPAIAQAEGCPKSYCPQPCHSSTQQCSSCGSLLGVLSNPNHPISIRSCRASPPSYTVGGTGSPGALQCSGLTHIST